MAKTILSIMITAWACFALLVSPVDSPAKPQPPATQIAGRASATPTRFVPTITPYIPPPSETNTPVPSDTATSTPSATATRTPLPPTATFTASPRPSLTGTATITSTSTITSTPTITPTFTRTATPTMTPTNTLFVASPLPTLTRPPASPTAVPVGPQTVNGISIGELVVMDDAVKEHVREIYACGVARGNNTHAFSRIGDCNSEPPHFLYRFDDGPYNLGDFAYVQPMIDSFKGSFRREGVAVQRGYRTWSVLDPMWADKSRCKSGESVLQCELRLNRPGVIIVRLGTNDLNAGLIFEKSLREIIETALSQGVIPILGTKADQLDGPDEPNNNMIRKLAAEYRVPLWDFELAARTLPGRGLEADGIHMTTFFAHDWRSPVAFQTGHGLQNITALLALYAVWQEMQPGAYCMGN